MMRTRLTCWIAAALVAAAAFAAPAFALAQTAPGASRPHHPYIGTRPTIPPVGSIAPAAITLETTSANWAGYAVQTQFPTGRTGSVSDVKATWVVPAVISGTSDAYAANWVGIDGYSSSTVEQIGTEQDWTRGFGASYSAWYEMFPAVSIPITTMNIQPGDVVTAEVSWISGTSYRLYIGDATTGESFAIVQTPPLGNTALRNSAEWIVEAPSDNTGVLPFTDQAPTTFTACSATVNGVTGPIGSPLWRWDSMTFVDGQTGAPVAVPSALNAAGDGFTVSPPVVVDTLPPTTVSDVASSYDNVATIHLSATDNAGGSGVAATYYQVDGLLTRSGTTVSVSTSGPHTLTFWSVDNAGNAEVHHTVNFTIRDTIPPTTVSDALPSYPANAIITLTAADNAGGAGVASTYYRLDGGAAQAGTVVNESTVGVHALTFWSVDNAGNQEPPHVATFAVGLFRLVYSAGSGGTIAGDASQAVAPGGSGTAVTAVPAAGFHFTGWSDGVVTATRQDLAVAADVIATATFAVNPRTATSASLSANVSSLRLGRYVTLSSRLAGAPTAGAVVRYEVKRPGSSSWALVSTRALGSSGASSLRYRPTRRGTYYFRVRFLGSSRLLPSISGSRRVRVL